jgi:hypothetical protein
MREVERAVPPSSAIDRYVESLAPDVVLVTPLVDVASTQADYVKSARRLRIPVGVCVASWDNLTNKGMIRVDADRVFVWNETQRREAIELHGVPEDRVVATGAQKFDQWFERQPSTTRDEFLHKVGLEPGRPFVLYVCSSHFIAPDEVGFVRRWAEALRDSADSRVRDVQVLVRPHPQNAAQWREADLSNLGGVAVYPRSGAFVTDETSRADFFDSLFHSAAVIGVNTSAMVEAAIVGKSVYTILAEEFSGTQEGTLHFRYLLHENGGFLRVARTLDDHVRQLAGGIDAPAGDASMRAFVESFLRPHGLDRPATPILAGEIERLGASASAPLVTTTTSRTAHALLSKVASAKRGRGGGARRAQAGVASQRLAAKRVELSLAHLRASREPVVVGPWLGDPATELLYWIPFVRWLLPRLELDPSKLHAVSRGRVAAWYADVCGSYSDLADLLDGDVARATRFGWRAERQRATELALHALGVDARRRRRRILQPVSMYQVFGTYRSGTAPLRGVLEHMRLSRFPPPAASLQTVPDRPFVALVPPDARASPEWLSSASAALGGLGGGSLLVSVDPNGGSAGGKVDVLAPLCDVEAEARLGAAGELIAAADVVVGAADAELLPLGALYGVPTLALLPGQAKVATPDLDLMTRIATELDAPFSIAHSLQLELLLRMSRRPVLEDQRA